MKSLHKKIALKAKKLAEAISDKQLPKEAFKEGYMIGFLHGSNEAIKRIFPDNVKIEQEEKRVPGHTLLRDFLRCGVLVRQTTGDL